MGLFGKKKNKLPKIMGDIYVLSGLDIPIESVCVLTLNEKNLLIKGAGKEFVLDIDKITNCEHSFDVNVEQYEKNGSIIKGIVGGVTFGIPGALIGSTPKIKEKRLVTGITMVSYEGKDGLINIVLMSKPNTLGSAELYDTLKPMITVRNQRIEL